MSAPDTVRVASTDPVSQGPFVIINAADYVPGVHTKYEPEAPQPPADPDLKRGPGRPRKPTGA